MRCLSDLLQIVEAKVEIFEHEPVSLYLSGLDLLETVKSGVQSIQIYQHDKLGKVLVIDDEIHNVERWAPLYHEAIVHIPMMFIEQPTSVLILGGGDLYAAEVVLQYPSVKEVVLCDYDQEVIRLTEKYYPHAKKVLSDKRLSVVYQDAKKYLSACDKQFDLIVDDCFNLIADFSPDEHIFQVLYNCLTPCVGVCSSLIYRHLFDHDTLSKTKDQLFKQFKTILSLITVPEYPGVLHLLTMWGKSPYLSQNMAKSKNLWHLEILKRKYPFGQLFDPRYCKYYLYLPNYVKETISIEVHNQNA